MSDALLSADPVPGSDVLLPVIETLCREAFTAGTITGVTGGARTGFSGSSYRERRGYVVCRISAALEREIGLRAGPARTPFCALLSRAENGDPLGGYIGEAAGYPVTRWLIDFFARWEAIDQVRTRWEQRGNPPHQVDNDTASVEGARLVRAALWYVLSFDSRDPVHAAIEYIAELTATGQVRSSYGAGRAIGWLIRCAGDDSTPVDLATALFGARAPTVQE